MAATLAVRRLATCVGQFQRSICNPTRVSQNIRCLSVSQRLFNERRYTDKHEWVQLSGNIGTVGITDYAQDKLGEIVYVSLPEVGSSLIKDEVAAELESVKAAAEVYCPGSGTVTEINTVLAEEPNKINTSPFDEGWLYKLELSSPGAINDLMDEDAYKSFTEQ